MITLANSLAWLTDLHLDSATARTRRKFYERLATDPADALVITGDISNAQLLPLHLREIAQAAGKRRVFFTLGNHDFYGSSFARVESMAAGVCAAHSNLIHLDGTQVIDLGRDTALIGHRGWSDGRTGWGDKSLAQNPDFSAIEDFKGLSRSQAFQLLRALGLQSAEKLRNCLPYALTCFNRIIIATHFPPALQAAKYRGKPCDWLRQPFFCNTAVGNMLLRMAQQFPRQEILVLCGHTHSQVSVKITPNLAIRSGTARPGFPSAGEMISLASRKQSTH